MLSKAVRLAAALAISALAGSVQAQNYPNKPIRIIVPFAAAGGVDLATRAVAEKMSEHLKQPVILELGEGPADSLKLETQVAANFLSGHAKDQR